MKTKKTNYLFVVCCLEDSRANILKDVVSNLKNNDSVYTDNLTVFDNGSTVPWVKNYLSDNFKNVFFSNENVGYWSAINWWLNSGCDLEYSYIIESDMIHYAMNKLFMCEEFLTSNEDCGSVRLHEYSVKNKHLYNKSSPVSGSKKTIWQSHINRVTNDQIKHDLSLDTPEVKIYKNNFLTQLPALNRTKSLKTVFQKLTEMKDFCEFDFQKLYWELHNGTSIIDDGIFNCDAGSYGKDIITGSWTDQNTLNKIGYKNTRFASIIDLNDMNVNKLDV